MNAMNAMNAMTVSSTSGARLHTEIHGRADGPTVVLVHGWTCQIRFWEPVLRLLTPDHRVVLYDQRGHGRTPATPGACSAPALADDLCAVLAAAVPPGRPAVVCGHSMGAMTIVAAADRPELRERAAALVLCSTGVDRLDIPTRTPRLRALRALLRTRLPYGPVTPLSRRIVRYITLGPGAAAADPALVDFTTRLVHACPRRVRAEWVRAVMAFDLSAQLPLLPHPVTIVHGTADRLTPLAHAHRMARRLPRAPELIELPGAGHMTPLEDPDPIAKMLRRLAT